MGIEYYKHKLENLIVVKDIVTIHYMELKKDFDFRYESHDFWEFVYADKQSAIARTRQKDVLLEEGEIIFHKPNEEHALAANGVTPTNVFIVSFACNSRAMKFFAGRKFKVSKSLAKLIYRIAEEGQKTFDLPHFDPNLTKMEFLAEPALGGQQLIKNYLEILLVSMMRAETQKAGAGVVFLREEERKESITAQAIAYMKENVAKKISVAEICEAVHYNKSYLFRTFKKDTGKTVMQYFIQLKIEKAKVYLREGSWNVAQIAEALGFDTPNYFTKTFRKLTGYSPLQYKKIYQTEL